MLVVTPRRRPDPKIPVLQARISSGLVRIATIRVTLSEFVSGLSEERLNRETSQANAAGAQHAGSALVIEIRRSRLSTFKRRWLPKV
jgi:hypothetical protein